MERIGHCAYLRKSRADYEAELRGDGETLARHRLRLSNLAEQMGIKISKWYCEIVSGDTISDRPVMQELLRDTAAGMWDGVLVVEVERLARGNTKDQGIVSETFKYSNTKIITPLKTYDPNNEFDEEYFEFGLFMSRREYKTINRRLQNGRQTSLAEGKYIGSTAPYGYVRVKIRRDKGYTLEIVPEQAKIVKQLYEWYCYGESLPDGSLHRLGPDLIADRLNRMGVRTVSGNPWTKSSISDILINKTYAGYVFFGKYKETKVVMNGKIVKRRIGNSSYLCYKGLHPAIIGEELFNLAQELRKQNRLNTVPSSSTLQNPLSGLIYCKKCGRLMTRLGVNSRNKYATLACTKRYCNNVSVPLFLVEEQLLRFLSDWLRDYELNNNIVSITPISTNIATLESRISQIDSDIAGKNKQLEKAYDLLEQGVYTLDVFRSRQQLLAQNISDLELSRENVLKDLAGLKALQNEREAFVPRVRQILDTYEHSSAEVNNQILKQIIERVDYEKDEPNRKGQLHRCNFTLDIFPKIPS